MKYFTISELGDSGRSQKTITPSSLPNEDQVEVRLPLATLRAVLRNQLLVVGRRHPNVDVGWPAAVGDGHVALQAIPSSLASKHRGGHYGTFRYGDGMSRNKVIEQAAKHTGYDRSRGYQKVEIREGKAS